MIQNDVWNDEGCCPKLYMVAAPRLDCAIHDVLLPKRLSREMRVAEAANEV